MGQITKQGKRTGSPSLNSDPRDTGCGGRPWVGGDPTGARGLRAPWSHLLIGGAPATWQEL